jgi:hypothetical protein
LALLFAYNLPFGQLVAKRALRALCKSRCLTQLDPILRHRNFFYAAKETIARKFSLEIGNYRYLSILYILARFGRSLPPTGQNPAISGDHRQTSAIFGRNLAESGRRLPRYQKIAAMGLRPIPQ